ncbi:hypothetical protein [Brachybacterium vulturis]|uniref:hypothetical protein n=1 Tax=Brachybacterium vulturis TaxID=2017484 RepID=UPI003734DF89
MLNLHEAHSGAGGTSARRHLTLTRTGLLGRLGFDDDAEEFGSVWDRASTVTIGR